MILWSKIKRNLVVFFGAGVDTLWGGQSGGAPDSDKTSRTGLVADALPARPPRIDPKSRKSASGAATGRQGVSEIRVYDG